MNLGIYLNSVLNTILSWEQSQCVVSVFSDQLQTDVFVNNVICWVQILPVILQRKNWEENKAELILVFKNYPKMTANLLQILLCIMDTITELTFIMKLFIRNCYSRWLFKWLKWNGRKRVDLHKTRNNSCAAINHNKWKISTLWQNQVVSKKKTKWKCSIFAISALIISSWPLATELLKNINKLN